MIRAPRRASAALALFLVAATAAGCALVAPRPLRVATSGDYAPFSLASDGALEGFDIDVARRLGADLGMRVEFVTVAWPDLSAATRRGDFDIAMGGVTMRADRALIGQYTRPYAVVGAVVLVREAYARRFASPDALDAAGVRIAVNAGGHLERVARERFPHAIIAAVPNNRAVLDRLLEGRADAVVSDTAEARSWLRPGVRALAPFRFDHKAYLLPVADTTLALRVDDWLVAREADGWLAGERARWLGTPATPNPAGATREAVAAFIGLRLALMPRIAAAKRAAGRPLVDTAQEQRVLERVRAQSTRPAYTEAVYRQLIELAKIVQRDAPATEAGASLDELRAAVARIDTALVRELDRTTAAAVEPWQTSLSRTMALPGIDNAALQQLAATLATP
jgi:cyclohexadienyl dehydratase